MNYEHDIFLSYNRADKAWVEQLASQIESETIDGLDTSRSLKAWFDEWDIDSGGNIITHINEGLKKSQFVATILSPEYLSKPFPELEWTHLVASDPTNKSRRLIPILRRDTSLDGKLRIDLPAPFLALKYIDFRDDTQFIRKFKELIRRARGLPPERGQRRPALTARTSGRPNVMPAFQPTEDAWEPDRVPDVIIGNMVPVPFATDAHLVVFRGEVSAVIESRENKRRHFIISGMARGGFSGGPVVWAKNPNAVLGVVVEALTKNNEVAELGFIAATSAIAVLETVDAHGLKIRSVEISKQGFILPPDRLV